MERNVVEIRRVFDLFDHNGDGKITMEDLQEQLRNMGIFVTDLDLAEMIDQVDASGNRCIDGDEFQALYHLIMKGRGEGQQEDIDDQEEEDVREAFNVFDKNHDGFISVEELWSVLSSLGLGRGRSLALEDCRQMITKVDVDGDGMISFLEFKKMMLESGGFANALDEHACMRETKREK